MRIGVIGGGISGLVAAHLLSRDHTVELFEANDYIGGHTHTEEVDRPDGSYRINTGFIVFNEANYPNFVKLLKRLKVGYQPAPMSFSVCSRQPELEYGFATLDTIFAQRRNLLSPRFIRMLLEIKRFRQQFESLLAGTASNHQTLGDYLKEQGFSQTFIDYFLMPFGAAIWSADPDQMGHFPLNTFVAFFKHHGFLNAEALLQWHTVTGGSDRYVATLLAPLGDRVHLNAAVTQVERHPNHIAVHTRDGDATQFDRVVIATHADQALGMIASPSEPERQILGDMPYQSNAITLHTDTSLLPKRRKTWSSWNYAISHPQNPCCTVTYDMNILQGITAEDEFLVSLNLDEQIDPAKILNRYTYDHPLYTPASVTAQSRYEEINGVDRIHYAGAYWGFGFHEDGVNSALAACAPLGVDLD